MLTELVKFGNNDGNQNVWFWVLKVCYVCFIADVRISYRQILTRSTKLQEKAAKLPPFPTATARVEEV